MPHLYASEPGVAVWDIPQRRIIARITAGEQGFFTGAAITRDGRQIITGTQAGELALWNTDDGALVRRFAGHAEQTLAVGISPDGSRAVSYRNDNGGDIPWSAWVRARRQSCVEMREKSISGGAVRNPAVICRWRGGPAAR